MTRFARRVALLSALLTIAVPSATDGWGAQDALNKRVSLDLKAMAPRDAFNVIASAIGYTVDVSPDVSKPVDIVVGNISARTALNTICESIGCTWQASGNVIRVTKPMTALRERRTLAPGRDQTKGAAKAAELRRRMNQVLPADMKFENAPMTEVAARLSKATGFDLTFSNVQGQTFSGDLGNQTFSSALRAIQQRLGGNVIVDLYVADAKGARISFAIKPRK